MCLRWRQDNVRYVFVSYRGRNVHHRNLRVFVFLCENRLRENILNRQRNRPRRSDSDANRNGNNESETDLREPNSVYRLPKKPAAHQHRRQQKKCDSLKEENFQ
jgi:hypothetical protein